MTRRLIDLDVREMLRAKEEPFQRIMTAISELDVGDVLQLHATFKPDPLLNVLAKRGFRHAVVQLEADHYVVDFYKSAEELPYFHLDNRGLQPPQPMVRTLEILEHQSEIKDGVLGLEIWNERVPAFLLPELDDAGFSHDVREDPDGTVCVRISRSLDEA
ncbi:DUF2249 domain-containing protein [Ferroacidibacillus organovorans]|uniref:Glutamine synthetase n=1 Tax=Ferroacidibacillus organovorans TaxID=1765683 RepID=A0A853KBR2_9BACL|nr:DUF2249 domain-containing protein [Ferroacidibacillus organovorans]KYP81092.1 glutamine synthetase [Ferroacidibacillus organovorans]OAG93794.1 glutamine synthetase [Ferroacidibacillus organovorans]